VSPRSILKNLVQGIFLVLLLPCGILSGFGRFRVLYTFWAHACAQMPGLVGDYARAAFYHLTLEACPMSSRICFGTFFSTPKAHLEDAVYIGAYCIIGQAHIGARTQIASAVHVVSGRHHHPRDSQGRILGAEQGTVQQIFIGSDCWIGEAAIVLADVGAGSTIGAGAVVTREIPPKVVAAGNPARVLRPASAGPPDLG